MTVTTGSFDDYGIPQGNRNQIDDLADVDVEEAKDGDALIYRGGRWSTGMGNEVVVGDKKPEDGAELWLDTSTTGSPLDDIYVNVNGDTMTAPLHINAPPQPQAGEEPPSFTVNKEVWPRIDLYKTSAGINSGRWKMYVSGNTPGATDLGDNTLSFAAGWDDPVATVNNQVTFRMYRSGMFQIPVGGRLQLPAAGGVNRYLCMGTASNGQPGIRVTQDVNGTDLAPLGVLDPSVPEHAATKAYTDGSGAFISVSAAVGSSASTATHLSTVDQAAVTWGTDIAQSGSALIVNRSGYYQLSFTGGFATSGSGTVRMLVLGDFDNGSSIPPNAANVNYIGQFVTPSTGTTGFGPLMSASGIWWIPATHRIILRGRQDSGATLNGFGTFTIRSIPGA